MAAMERPMCWQLSDWTLRGCREVNWRERGVANMVGVVATAARRVRMVWSCILDEWMEVLDFRGFI